MSNSRTDLTHRERVRLALAHQTTDRVPIATVCSGINAPAHAALTEYLAAERNTTVEEFLRPLIDIRSVGPQYVGPALKEREDLWGVRRQPVSYGEGSYNEIDFHPLAEASSVDDLDKHRWPTTEWFDYSTLVGQIATIRAEDDYCIMIGNGNIFETSWYMRGFREMFMDLASQPELAREIFQRVCDFYVAHFEQVLTAAGDEIDLIFTADDIGGQTGLLMSLDMWTEFIKPHHKRLNALIHEFDCKIIYHSDGAVMDAVPGLIDMGIDILQALQFDAKGMDAEQLKREHGDVLCFEGGISVQQTLPFGTVDDVRREVQERIDVLGRNGGYILGPSHAIQAGTPPENIVALFETAAAHPMP